VASLVRDRWLFGVEHGPVAILTNLTFVFNFWPGHEEGIAWASWAIRVEILFYVIFSALVACASTSPKATAVLLALLVTVVYEVLLRPMGLQSPLGQYGVVRHLPVFVAGVLAYRVFQRFIEPGAAARAAGTTLLLGAAYLYASLLSTPFHKYGDVFPRGDSWRHDRLILDQGDASCQGKAHR
jgi:peptidoglycan/LPS O-acetylase OafA/YrhL